MSDIHQEWKDLRQKNGNFINHLDGEMAKLEKKQVELKRYDQLQDLTDAGAFAMQFIAPPPFNCCQDDRDILKALNKAQADRIKHLEDELLTYKEQRQVDLAVKKELDEKLYHAAESYANLAAKKDNLAKTVTRMEKVIRDLDERNGNLRSRLENTNASLKRSVQESNKLQDNVTYLDNLRRCQAKEIKRLREIVNTPNGSCSAYAQQGMQSKIAKQANEIKRLTEENEILKDGYSDQAKQISGLLSAQATLKHEIDTLHGALDIAAKDADENLERCNVLQKNNEDLKESLKIVAKDAEANFERGKIKGMEEIWDELGDVYGRLSVGKNEKIFGYRTVGEIVDNLSPTWFMREAREYHEQKEKEASVIKIGDEVEIFDPFCPDDDPHSDFAIVIEIDNGTKRFSAVGPYITCSFNETDIDAGIVQKTGRHFDSIPLDYLA